MEQTEYYNKPRFLPVGDRALVAEFGRTIDERVNEQVQMLFRTLEKRPIRGVTELIPTFRSLLICYDPAIISYFRLVRKLERVSLSDEKKLGIVKRILEVPCLYDGEDLADMERITGLNRAEIIRIHSSPTYKVYMLGFLPGFVYLGGLDERICAPRLSSPRIKIPEGSVGIGGNQTGVYPMASPGGWRLIGRTPLKFYDPERTEPILCRAGEYIRFVPVEQAEYVRISEQIGEKLYAPSWKEEGSDIE